MKIVQVHNYYKIPGGEDEVVRNEKLLLEQHKHEVVQYTALTNDLNVIQLTYKLLFDSRYSKSECTRFAAFLRRHKPDLVHIHNTFPIFTPSLYDACKEINVPCVQTLHNFRILYPNALLYDEKLGVDLRTIKASAWSVVKDRVYRNSLILTFLMAYYIEFHKKRDTWNQKVPHFIVLTDFSKQIFEDFGIQRTKMTVKPNFMLSDPRSLTLPEIDESGSFFLYVGRLSPEKGILEMVKNWTSTQKLIVVGDGPLKQELTAVRHPTVKLVGKKEKSEVLAYMNRATALVFPSMCFEGFPLVIAEAFACGLPVICSNIGNQASIVQDGIDGIHAQLGDPKIYGYIADGLANDTELRQQLGTRARSTYESAYSAEKNYEQLLAIYRHLTNYA